MQDPNFSVPPARRFPGRLSSINPGLKILFHARVQANSPQVLKSYVEKKQTFWEAAPATMFRQSGAASGAVSPAGIFPGGCHSRCLRSRSLLHERAGTHLSSRGEAASTNWFASFWLSGQNAIVVIPHPPAQKWRAVFGRGFISQWPIVFEVPPQRGQFFNPGFRQILGPGILS